MPRISPPYALKQTLSSAFVPSLLITVRFSTSSLSLTFLGSLVWSYVLVYVGVKLGEHLDKLKSIWHKFDIVIIATCLILGGIYVWKHIKHLKEE